MSLIGCRGDNDKPDSTAGGTGDGTRGTEAVQGGTLIAQPQTYPRTFQKVVGTESTISGLAHGSLLQFKYGRAGVDAYDYSAEPDHAAAMPEQPDQLTYIFKLKDGIKFHNGRTVTAEDVKYSWERWAFDPESTQAPNLFWLDSVQTPDDKTVVFKSKMPWADALISFAPYSFGFILAKEFEESPEATRKLMGSGPYIFEDTTPPVQTRLRRNPEYYDKPRPYFDNITFLGAVDPSKQEADVQAGSVDVTYTVPLSSAKQMRQNRTYKEWSLLYGCHYLTVRVDQPPLNDVRVRQALSMAIDRKKIRAATMDGEGEDDQMMSPVLKGWGFRKPSELKSAKNWNYDPAAARQLLSAAGVSLPMRFEMIHADNIFLGQAFVDHATLTQAEWRQLGIAEVRDVSVPVTQLTPANLGNYNHFYLQPNAIGNSITFGLQLRSNFFSNRDGTFAPVNNGHVVDQQLNDLVDKQAQQLDIEQRKATLRQVEDILSEQMYKIPYSTYNYYVFTSSSLQGLEVPKTHFGGSYNYFKWWWKKA